MRLWCDPCEAVHEFTDRQDERIMYALVAMVQDIRLERAFPSRDPIGLVQAVCLNKVLMMAGDPEMYLPEVDAFLARKARGSSYGARSDN